MLLRHILAAADESDAGRQAVRTALDLGSRSSARVTILRVVAAERRLVSVGDGPLYSTEADDEPALTQLRGWLGADVLSPEVAEAAELGIAYGLPSIEVCRFAERAQVDLLVLGRKRHSPMMRLLMGDTADAVARRSRFPCLFVPPGFSELKQVLVALDGTDRGISVLNQACDFGRYTGASIEAVTVERGPADEVGSTAPKFPVARSLLLDTAVRETLGREGFPLTPLGIRRGDIVAEILQAVGEVESDVLAVGYHRGGLPGVLEAGSTARRLAHAAPCAVLTIPL